ncbi:MAG: hypothetical protein HQK52_08880 [Oligoflexia bacterium]|nr:hypothetical protein [Oligoflexia bacterium]
MKLLAPFLSVMFLSISIFLSESFCSNNFNTKDEYVSADLLWKDIIAKVNNDSNTIYGLAADCFNSQYLSSLSIWIIVSKKDKNVRFIIIGRPSSEAMSTDDLFTSSFYMDVIPNNDLNKMSFNLSEWSREAFPDAIYPYGYLTDVPLWNKISQYKINQITLSFYKKNNLQAEVLLSLINNEKHTREVMIENCSVDIGGAHY